MSYLSRGPLSLSHQRSQPRSRLHSLGHLRTAPDVDPQHPELLLDLLDDMARVQSG
jgi:hypothetical protein